MPSSSDESASWNLVSIGQDKLAIEERERKGRRLR
jgi:hypothetical protein